jgi:hypothetical protein
MKVQRYIDGCHWHDYGNQLLPLAFALVEGENNES